MRNLIASLVLAMATTACDGGAIVVGGLQEVANMRAIPNSNLDLLFVIDNSPSMADKQASLAASFPKMIDVLGQLDGGLPSLHIGIVTSDMGTSGANATSPGPSVGQPGNGGCAGYGDDGALKFTSAMQEHWISDIAMPDGTRTRNYTGELRDVFGQAAQVGAGGCGFEQHLSAMRRALTNPANAGFVRPDANLAVIVLADEDDCSLLDPSLLGPDSAALGPLSSFRCFAHGVECAPDATSIGPKSHCVPHASSPLIEDIHPFADALLATKPDPRMIMVGAIVGDPDPVAVELRPTPGGSTAQPALAHSCAYAGSTGPEVADPGVRLAAFLDQFPQRSTLASICSADLSSPLHALGTTAKRLVGDPCLDTSLLADTSPAPGIQPACEVVDVRDSAPNHPIGLPPCADGAGTCFELAADAAGCPSTPDHLRVRIHRNAAVDADTWTHVRCQLQN